VSGRDFTLREAGPEDLPVLLGFVRKLAEYERLADQVRATEDDLRASLFGPSPRAHALLAETGDGPVGFAVWFYNFSTFAGRAGIYIEDVFVEPSHRGRGIGRGIFSHLARRAMAEGCPRVEWAVLNWNAPAIGFYRGLGARPMDEWTVQRMSGAALMALAEGS
jgi:GNAT superfamily N-acetyltransferase